MIKKPIILAIIILLLDSIYLTVLNKQFMNQIKLIQNNDNVIINKYSALICYSILVFGLYHFIIKEKKNPNEAFILGFVIYSVFDSTTVAIFKDWSYKLAIIDSIWGGILFYTTTKIYNKIN